MIDVVDNKRYEICDLHTHPDIFRGEYVNSKSDTYDIPESMLKNIAKDLGGFSLELYQALNDIDNSIADDMVRSISKTKPQQSIALLLDDEEMSVVGYSFDSERPPVLNTDFIHRAENILATESEIEIKEKYYDKESTTSSLLIVKKSPIVIEEKYTDKPSKFIEYNIGIFLVNEETSSVYTRLVVYISGQPFYLPASTYNVTNSRYRRSSSNNSESLELVLLRIVDDLRGEELSQRIQDFHYRYRANKDIASSYEEYNTVLKTMRKIPTIIEDSRFLEKLLSKYENFERKYGHMEDQKSSYLWRCTALSDISVGTLVEITADILSELYAPTIEYYSIRDLIGYYLSTPRLAEEIAKESLI